MEFSRMRHLGSILWQMPRASSRIERLLVRLAQLPSGYDNLQTLNHRSPEPPLGNSCFYPFLFLGCECFTLLSGVLHAFDSRSLLGCGRRSADQRMGSHAALGRDQAIPAR